MAEKLEGQALSAAVETLQGWTVKDNKLHRVLNFANFVEAFAFMTQIALIAERMNHHPDWCNSYKTVAISLSSHDSGGITHRDIALAQAIDGLLV